MKTTMGWWTVCVMWLAIQGMVWAQPEGVNEEDHVALRALREELVKGITEGNMDAIEARLHPEVIITWQDGRVCRGPKEVRKFYEEMAAKSKKAFQGYKVPPTADQKTILHADGSTGVVSGSHVGIFHLAGKDFEMPNRWTATVVKVDGRWLLAGYHVSMNVLDNPLLGAVRSGGVIAAILSGAVGVALGWWIGRRRRSRAGA